MDVLYTAQPSERPNSPWYVWNMYSAGPPQPVFVGEMEECQAVAEALNALHERKPLASAGWFVEFEIKEALGLQSECPGCGDCLPKTPENQGILPAEGSAAACRNTGISCVGLAQDRIAARDRELVRRALECAVATVISAGNRTGAKNALEAFAANPDALDAAIRRWEEE